MKLLNNKQIRILSQYESYFETITKAKYKRASTYKANTTVADIYEETTGEILTRNWSCPNCTYRIWEKVAKLYYKSKELVEDKKVETKSPKKEKINTKNKKSTKK